MSVWAALVVVLACMAAVLVAGVQAAVTPSTKDILGIYRIHNAAYQAAMERGCRVVNLPEQGTFFVYWLPEGFERLPEKCVVVMLHGTNGNAYRHLLNLYETAAQEKFALVSIQWGWPRESCTGMGRGAPMRRGASLSVPFAESGL